MATKSGRQVTTRRSETRHLLPVGLALVFGALYFLGLGQVGLLDYDEAAYAEVAREMVAGGDWVSPRLDGRDFFEKPPLLYWSIAAGYRLFGTSAFAARAVNAAVATLFLPALFGLSRRPLGERGALLACLVLGSSVGYAVLARIALTDMLLTVCVVLGLLCFHRAFEATAVAAGRGWFWAGSLCCGLAMLAKGAIGILLPASAVFVFLVLSRRARLLLRPSWLIPGLLIALPVGLSWYALLAWTHEGGLGFTRVLFWEHHVGRFTEPMQGHRGPTWFYLPALIAGLFPWSFFAVPALARGGLLRGHDDERRRYLRLLAIFAAVVFCFFSVAATKLPHYVAPAIPCLAVPIAAFLDRRIGGKARRDAAGFATAALLVAGAAFLWALGPLLRRGPELLGRASHQYPALGPTADLGPWPTWAGVVLLATAAAVATCAARRSLRAVVASVALGGVLFLGTLFTGVMPRADALLAAPLRTLAMRAAVLAPRDRPLALVGIRRKPSLVFYGGRPTLSVDRDAPDALRDLCTGPEPGVGIIAAADVGRLRAHGAVEVIDERGGYALFRCVPGGLRSGPGS